MFVLFVSGWNYEKESERNILMESFFFIIFDYVLVRLGLSRVPSLIP
jgi:hypothetical protein